jgi:uncharacterized protein YdaU (DUF1376 family)
MAKDPAFLFYSKDFLAGVQDLTMEERGQYITLLCVQHQKGRLSEKAIGLCVGNAAADVMAKFRQDSAGLWYNERLELESDKRKAHSEKQAERARDGWKKRKTDATAHTAASAAALPLVNANAIVNGIDVLLKESLDEIFIEQLRMKWNHVDFDFELSAFQDKVKSAPTAYQSHDSDGIRLALQSQLRYAKSKPKNHATINPGKLQ